MNPATRVLVAAAVVGLLVAAGFLVAEAGPAGDVAATAILLFLALGGPRIMSGRKK